MMQRLYTSFIQLTFDSNYDNSSVFHTVFNKKVDTTSDADNYLSIIMKLLMAKMISPIVQLQIMLIKKLLLQLLPHVSEQVSNSTTVTSKKNDQL